MTEKTEYSKQKRQSYDIYESRSDYYSGFRRVSRQKCTSLEVKALKDSSYYLKRVKK